jgi:hypothetical protein
MKKYHPFISWADGHEGKETEPDAKMLVSLQGTYVRADLAEEMLAVLKEALVHMDKTIESTTSIDVSEIFKLWAQNELRNKLQAIITKAEEA